MRRAYPPLIVWPLVLGASLNAINTSMIATAIVPIARELAVSPGHVMVLVSALYVASAVAQPVFGALADRFGPRSTFIVGMVITGVGGVVGGCAGALPALVLARVLAGVGTAAGYPSVMVLLRDRELSTNVPVPSRILGRIAIAVQVAGALGLPLGGLLTAVLGWRATFWINVPAATVLVVAALVWFPSSAEGRVRSGSAGLLRVLDPVGVALFAILVTTLALALVPDPRAHWAPYALVVAALVALVAWERRAAAPFLDVSVVRLRPGLVWTLVRNLLTFVAMYGYLYGVTQWLQDERALDALAAALLLAPMAALSIAIATVAARFDAVRTPLALGSASGIGGAALLTLVGATSPLWLVVLASLSMGVMTGLTAVANQAAMFAQAPPERIGAASGMMRASSNVAAILASGLIAFWYPIRADDVGLGGVSLTIMGLSGAVLVITLMDRRLAVRRRAPRAVRRGRGS